MALALAQPHVNASANKQKVPNEPNLEEGNTKFSGDHPEEDVEDKPAKAPRKKRPKLTADLLLGPTGMPLLKKRLEMASFSGGERGHELQDLRKLMYEYKKWGLEFYPSLHFEDLLSRMQGQMSKLRHQFFVPLREKEFCSFNDRKERLDDINKDDFDGIDDLADSDLLTLSMLPTEHGTPDPEHTTLDPGTHSGVGFRTEKEQAERDAKELRELGVESTRLSNPAIESVETFGACVTPTTAVTEERTTISIESSLEHIKECAQE